MGTVQAYAADSSEDAVPVVIANFAGFVTDPDPQVLVYAIAVAEEDATAIPPITAAQVTAATAVLNSIETEGSMLQTVPATALTAATYDDDGDSATAEVYDDRLLEDGGTNIHRFVITADDLSLIHISEPTRPY